MDLQERLSIRYKLMGKDPLAYYTEKSRENTQPKSLSESFKKGEKMPIWKSKQTTEQVDINPNALDINLLEGTPVMKENPGAIKVEKGKHKVI